jgi:DnaJ-class molecular chaperone
MPTFKLYDILQVENNASQEDIKKKYRKLVVHHHPDKKGGDPEKFKEITNAYEILSDETKRKQYDMIGDNENLKDILNNAEGFPFGMNGNHMHPMHEMHGMHGMHGMPFDMDGSSPFENIFQNFFGMQMNNKKRKGKNIEKTVKINLRDAYFGIKKKYDINMSRYCDKCNQPCNECKGEGYINKVIGNFGIMIQQRVNCNTCKSKGIINKCNNNCTVCNGKGNYNIKENINIDIIPGVKTGMKIIAENKGDEMLIVENNNFIHVQGDLILNIIVEEKDDNFVVDDNNLIYNLTIPYWKLLTHIDHLYINHYKDKNLKIDFSEPINHNKIYVYKKLGMPIINSNGNYGDLIIKFNVLFPSNRLKDDNIEKLQSVLKNFDILN